MCDFHVRYKTKSFDIKTKSYHLMPNKCQWYLWFLKNPWRTTEWEINSNPPSRFIFYIFTEFEITPN